MKYLGKFLKTRTSAAYLVAVVVVIGLALVNCGGGGYGGGGGYMSTPGPGVFHLSMPANGAKMQGTTPTLTWTTSLYATSYIVEVSADNFAHLVPLTNSTVAGTSYTVAPPLTAGTYSWQVRAHNAGGDMLSSETFTFSTS